MLSPSLICTANTPRSNSRRSLEIAKLRSLLAAFLGTGKLTVTGASRWWLVGFLILISSAEESMFPSPQNNPSFTVREETNLPSCTQAVNETKHPLSDDQNSFTCAPRDAEISRSARGTVHISWENHKCRETLRIELRQTKKGNHA